MTATNGASVCACVCHPEHILVKLNDSIPHFLRISKPPAQHSPTAAYSSEHHLYKNTCVAHVLLPTPSENDVRGKAGNPQGQDVKVDGLPGKPRRKSKILSAAWVVVVGVRGITILFV